MKKAFSVLLLASTILSAAQVFAAPGSPGDVSCDSSWKYCLASIRMDSTGNEHYITWVTVDGKTIELPDVDPTMVVSGTDSKVYLKNQAGAQVLVGTIQPTLSPSSAGSANFTPAPGIELAIGEQPGSNQTLCNQTAVGVVYERYTYKTVDQTLTITENNHAIAQLKSNRRVEPAISNFVSPFPCRK